MRDKAAMGVLELNFLGDLEVVRDGEAMTLPPSKKTRALLAYLALNQRPFRREHLCELLWEIPDDPRGSLRWSLSKLRRLVDDAERTRIVADRASVGFDASDVVIDVCALRALAADGLAEATIDVLECAVSRYRGSLLEGLELSNFHEYHAWCTAERDQAARAQVSVLRTLVLRLADAPQNALPHARQLVAIDPYDAESRASLVRLLVALGRSEEAEQQFRLGARMLEEIGAPPSNALFEAWRGRPGGSRTAPRQHTPEARSEPAAQVSSELIGREAETSRLSSAYARVVQTRRAQFVLVRGGPGIGKSRLLETVAEIARANDAFLLQARAFELEAIRPFALWIDAFRGLDSDAAPNVFAEQDLGNRDRLFGVMSDLVARQSRTRPVVLLFDDVQWCDESSAAALHYVARMNRQRPLLGILAARTGEVRDNSAVQQALRGLRHDDVLEEMKLGPLSEEAVCRLIEARAPGMDCERLSRECRGNPLLAIELCRGEAAGARGSSLDELVRERLSRCDTDSAELLRWAAVLAPRIELPWLVRVTGFAAPRVGEALDRAERDAILVASDGGFLFSHDLVARCIYNDISPARRRMMHRRAAELLEQDTALDLGHASDLAHHASQSGDPALAARAMISAGRLCLRFFANDDALALARTGLQQAGQLGDAERVCLLLELHDIMLSAAPLDDWHARAAEYASLAEQALDHGALSHARLGYQMASYVRWANGNWAGAREETLQAERVIRGAGDEDQIIGMAETAKCLAMLERDLTHADAMLMEAKSLAVRQRVSHSAIPAALGMLRYHENRLDEAEELFKEARTLCKAAGDRVNEFQANEYLVMIDFERRRLESACERCATLVEIGAKLREGSEAPFARALEGLCRYALHDVTETLDAALEDLRIADAKHRLAYVLCRAAQLDVERGRPGDALVRAREALGHAEALERATEMLLAHVVLVQAHEATGDAEGAERHTHAVARLERLPVAQWARNHAAGLQSANVDWHTP
jgi:DNA-binding SARP family transcriptional activator/tetratricopeptide (TPR) repeat protein